MSDAIPRDGLENRPTFHHTNLKDKDVTVPPNPRVWPRLLAGCLIVAVTGRRIAYLLFDCPLDLAPDEAHYWDWSRHLDWCYYSKGPLVAYLIRVSCGLFGGLSRAWIGSEMFAVRLPALVCGALLLAALYILTVQVFRRERLALAVVALALTLPMMSAGALLMTIDGPYTCCWAWASVFGYQAIFGGSRWAWLAAGIVMAIGILAKFTMGLWLPSLGLFLLVSPAQRRLLIRPGFWITSAVGLLGVVPVLVWNAQHGWVTFLHMRGHAGFAQANSVRWLGPFVYIGGQFLLLLGYWFVTWICAMIYFRPGKSDAPASYLWWLSAPMFVFFLLFSLKNGGGEVNWPVTTYLSGMVLTVSWLGQRLQSMAGAYRLLSLGGILLAAGLGVALSLLMQESNWSRPLLVRLAGQPTRERPLPLRRWDPTCRLRGWRTLAAEVNRLRANYQRAGIDPVVTTLRWDMSGELGFYGTGQPTVYSVGVAFGERYSQYDLWRPNPLADGGAYYGRTFIFIALEPPSLGDAFDAVEPARIVTHSEDGVPIARWAIVVAHGFRGSLELTGRSHRRY